MTKYIHTLNWSHIHPKLYIGSCPLTTEDAHTICREVKPSVILSLQTTECHKAHNIKHEDVIQIIKDYDVEYLWCPMLDFNLRDQQIRLPAAIKMLDVALNKGIVYMHCTAGINRSPLVALSHLVFIQGETLDDALTHIQLKRPESEPYIDAFLGCRDDITTANKERINQQAYYNYLDGEDDQKRNWYSAEKKVIRDVILGLPSSSYLTTTQIKHIVA